MGAERVTFAGQRGLCVIVATSLATRIAALLLTPGYRPIHDDASYARVARSLVTLRRYPLHRIPGGLLQASAYRPPGWPALLALLWTFTGPDVRAGRLLLVALGATTALLVAAIADELWGRATGIAAGMLVALSPPLIAVGASLESETLFITMVAGSVWCALRARRGPPGWALSAGALAGAAALTRANGLVLLPLVALLCLAPRMRPWPAMGRLTVVLACGAVLIVPWTVRNALVVDRFVPVSDEMGNTLAGTYNTASMNHDAQWLEPRDIGAYRAVYRRFGASAAGDGALVAAVGDWVGRHPSYPAEVLAENSLRMSGLRGPRWAASSLDTMSLGRRAGALVWAGLVALLVLAAAGLHHVRRRSGPITLWLIPLALYLSAAMVNGELRLVTPVLPFAALLAAQPAVRLVRWRHSAARRLT